MADGSSIVGAKCTPSPTPEQLTALAPYRYVMDRDCVAAMHQIRGIAQLMMGAIELDEVSDKLPPGLNEGLWAINDLAQRALVKAGAA